MILEKVAQLEPQKALGIGLVVGALYYMALFDDGSVLKANIAQLQQDVEAEKVKKVETDKARAQEKESQRQIEELKNSIVTVTSQMPVNLKGLDVARTIDIESMRAEIKVTEKKPGTAAPLAMAQVEEVPVEIELEGKFSNFVNFLLGISSNSQITRIKSFRMQNSDLREDPTKLKITAVIVGYRSLPPESQPKESAGQQ